MLFRSNNKVALTKGCITYALDERNQDINVKLDGKICSIKEIDPGFNVREAFEVEFDSGEKLFFTDYASAGSEWDKAKNNVTVWIDKK